MTIIHPPPPLGAQSDALSTALVQVDRDDPCFSRWEERFDMTDLAAMLRLLAAMHAELPPVAQHPLLRLAGRLPGLFGHFGYDGDRIAFFSMEGERITAGERWLVHENGEQERLW